MKLKASATAALKAKTEALGFALFKDEKPSGSLKELDETLNHELANALKQKTFTGEVGDAVVIQSGGKYLFKRVLVTGLGDKNKCNPEIFRRAAANLALVSAGTNCSTLTVAFNELTFSGKGSEDFLRAGAEGVALSQYSFDAFKSKETLEKQRKVKEAEFLVSGNHAAAAKRILAETHALVDSVFLARDFINLPPSIKTPEYLAEKTRELCRKFGVKCKVYNKQQIRKLGLNALLAVNAGSENEPRFVVMEYGRGKKPVALVGKGITFDSGGLNLKPFQNMQNMKEDMSGAATVIGATIAAARLKLKTHILGIVALTENMPGNKAYKQGDIIRALNGKTIEIFHTDAEGRVILADALSYAVKQKPSAIIDLATLTGAVVVALGRYYAGTMTNDANLLKEVMAASERTGEMAWQLPLDPEHEDLIKSDLADVRNTSKGWSGESGTITAGAFLKQFVSDIPWLHFDIAATAFFEDFDKKRPYLQKGATGWGVRLLVEFLRSRK